MIASGDLFFAGLIILGFVAGVGTTTLGPGGIFVTISLYAVTTLSSATVAGTASATFIGTGVVGTVMFARSGELDTPYRRTAIILAASSVIGAFLGSELNTHLADHVFGLFLAAFVTIIGVSIVYREYFGLTPRYVVDPQASTGSIVVAGVGTGVGGVGGLLGVGGPVMAVPILVLIGVPMLPALAVAQVQSVVLASVATANYAGHQAVSALLVVLIGIPQVAGAVVGWRVAHRVDPERLKLLLGLLLVGLGPLLAL